MGRLLWWTPKGYISQGYGRYLVATYMATLLKKGLADVAIPLKLLACLEGLEPPTFGFVVLISIKIIFPYLSLLIDIIDFFQINILRISPKIPLFPFSGGKKAGNFSLV